MTDLRDQSVLILGLGDSGLAMARWCARHGARVRVADSRLQPPQAAALAQDCPQAELVHGLHPQCLQGVNLLLKSPGLSPLAADVAAVLQQAQAQGVPAWGELQLFVTALAELRRDWGYAPKVLAITGTNGKTTTTSLTAMLVERTGQRVAVAGNIGPTLLDTLSAAWTQEQAWRLNQASTVQANLLDGLASQSAEVTGTSPLGLQGADERFGGSASESLNESIGESPSESLSESLSESPSEPFGEQAAEQEPLGGSELEQDLQQDLQQDTSHDLVPEGDLPPPPAELDPPAAVAQALLAPAPQPRFVALPEVWVLELSSFQLEGVSGFEPDAAVVLNLSQDHLDWHGDMARYAAAKQRIYGQHALMVVNRDDPMVEAMVPAVQWVKPTGRSRGPARAVQRRVCRFGLGAPRHAGDFGLVVEAGVAWLVRAWPAQEPASSRAGACRDEPAQGWQRLMPADALRIRGRHNAGNALAALALATAIGCPLAPMLHGLREYRGEPHRVEWVMSLDGVEAFDDSKGTNVGATVAALEGLGGERQSQRGALWVILGGDGKGQDFSPLRAPIARHAKGVALIGRDAAQIEHVLEGVADAHGQAIAISRHNSLPEATRWCLAQASSGEAVLLSPACASLDMFRNYAHRAEVFVQTLRESALERGELA